MYQGRGNLGSRKHGKSGHCGKSPKMRLHEKMQAEKNQKKKPTQKMFNSVSKLFNAAKI